MTEIENIEFNKKVSLIYEYNKNSPLFVRVANSELEKNNIDEAIEILDTGLRIFKEHPTANLLLGKAYALNGRYSDALGLFQKASKILRSDRTYDYYANELETIRKQRSLFETTKGKAFLNSSIDSELSISDDDIYYTDTETTSSDDLVASIDERLEQLAEEISKAKLSHSFEKGYSDKNLLDNLPGDNLILSETLAEIYLSQNELDEAIRVYEKLINKDASKYEYYTGKIIEIRSKLES